MYGSLSDFCYFDSHQGNEWFFPPGGFVAVGGAISFYPPGDPRNIGNFSSILQSTTVGETVVATSDGTNFTLMANLDPYSINPKLTDFYGISGNPSSAVLNLQWENDPVDSLFAGDATGTLVIDYVPEPSSLLLFASAAGVAVLA